MVLFLDACPKHMFCCCNIPLRGGVFLIGLFGLMWAGLWIFGYTDNGIKLYPENSIPAIMKRGIQYVHGVFGVLLAISHFFLLIGVIAESKIILEFFIWMMIVVWVFIALSVLMMGMVFGKQEIFLFMMAFYVPFVVAPLLTWVYFMVIVGNYRLTIP